MSKITRRAMLAAIPLGGIVSLAAAGAASAAPADSATTGRELVVRHVRGGTYELAVLDAEGQAMPLAKFEADGWQLVGVAVDGEGRQVGIFRQGW